MALPDARTIGYVEIDVAFCAILVAQIQKGLLDDAPVWTDARTFDGKPWCGAVDILVAGYPCQPFSVGGKRRGFDDERNLWPEVRRIVAECRPAFVFLENVAGHLQLGYFDAVEPDLRGLGYTGPPPLLVSAAYVGAPHRRERMFALHVRMEDAASFPARISPQNMRAIPWTHYGSGEDADWPQAWPPGPSDSAWDTIDDDLFPVEPRVRGMDDGMAKGIDISPIDRIRALGNGVVPQQAAVALSVLMGELASQRGQMAHP